MSWDPRGCPGPRLPRCSHRTSDTLGFGLCCSQHTETHALEASLQAPCLWERRGSEECGPSPSSASKSRQHINEPSPRDTGQGTPQLRGHKSNTGRLHVLTVTLPQAEASVPSHQPPAPPASYPSAQSLAQLRVWIVTKQVKFSHHHPEVTDAFISQHRQLIIIFPRLKFQNCPCPAQVRVCCSCSPRRWTVVASSVGFNNLVPLKRTRHTEESTESPAT